MSAPIMSHLIQSSSSSTASPPPLHTTITSPPLPPHQQLHLRRRDAAAVLLSVFSLFPSLNQPPKAAALSFGISGPKDWLREQKKKASKFVLAPIDASRNSLQFAYQSLTNGKLDYTTKDLEDVQRLLKSAARDCILEDRDSLITFQANTGVEVCTFKLVVNNAASLLDDKDPVKLEAEAKLSDLVRSFTSLSGVANAVDIQLASNRQKMADALMDTIASLNNFEQGIKDCLEI
ncbi:hypothetical protein DCAR_0522346 [Daucus carota subsp. sativus]|uniref:Chloroplast thylakoid membrane n=1 Tax=Daucus carota subsp. sativus TaxID=79200 RepID=A0AAF0XAW4_DAUCS|nr:PREDICTED: uncharacterized protein LOC108223634 [Daucus carota subsp. sativus]WOH02956.1 hypothetical protein DCAR_0522346 [Daucus carota subsp. sativus]